jgi:hypothetical protein
LLELEIYAEYSTRTGAVTGVGPKEIHITAARASKMAAPSKATVFDGIVIFFLGNGGLYGSFAGDVAVTTIFSASSLGGAASAFSLVGEISSNASGVC